MKNIVFVTDEVTIILSIKNIEQRNKLTEKQLIHIIRVKLAHKICLFIFPNVYCCFILIVLIKIYTFIFFQKVQQYKNEPIKLTFQL